MIVLQEFTAVYIYTYIPKNNGTYVKIDTSVELTISKDFFKYLKSILFCYFREGSAHNTFFYATSTLLHCNKGAHKFQ